MISEAWSGANAAEALTFLKSRYATSMFLLGNLEEHGPTLSTHSNSGNFKVLRTGSEIVGVFCLTRRGNLLLTGPSEASERIIRESLTEKISIQGVLGEWEISSAVWKLLQEKQILSTCSFDSKEILYQLDELPKSDPVVKVRFLSPSDYPQWDPIQRAYLAEEGIQVDLDYETRKQNFAIITEKKKVWGYFEGERMISTAALNAKALDIGQVGGVYTVPELRCKGYSQQTMRQMLLDCAQVHGLKSMILFTGEKSLAAQRVYEKLGFRRIGRFGIFFA